MSKFARGIFTATESATDTIDTHVYDLQQSPPDLYEDGIDAASARMEHDLYAFEAYADDLDTLESLQTAVSTRHAHGQALDGFSAEMMQISVESICQRLALPTHRFMPSLEAFGSVNAQRYATTIALEGVGEALRLGYEKFIQWMKAIINGIKAFFAKVFNFIKGLFGKGKELEEKAKKIDKDAKPKKDTIKDAHLVHLLGDEKGNVTLSGVKARMTAAIEITDIARKMADLTDTEIALMQKSNHELDQLIKSSTDKKVFGEILDKLHEVYAKAEHGYQSNLSHAYSQMKNMSLTNNVRLTFNDDEVPQLTSVDFSDSTDVKELTAPGKKEIVEIIDKIKLLDDASNVILTKLNKTIERLQKVINGFIELLNKAEKRSSKKHTVLTEEQKEIAKMIRKEKQRTQETLKNFTHYSHLSLKVVTEILKAATEYCVKGLSNFELAVEDGSLDAYMTN